MQPFKVTSKLFSDSLGTKLHWRFNRRSDILLSCMPCEAVIPSAYIYCSEPRQTQTSMVTTIHSTRRLRLLPRAGIFRLFEHSLQPVLTSDCTGVMGSALQNALRATRDITRFQSFFATMN